MSVVSNVVAGLLVCKLKTLLMDTLVVLGLRGVLPIVQLNKLGIGSRRLRLTLLTWTKLVGILLNRTCTGEDGSTNLVLMGRCSKLLPL